MLRNEALAPEFSSSRDARMQFSFEATCSLNDGVPSPAPGRQQLVTSQQMPSEMSMCQGLCRPRAHRTWCIPRSCCLVPLAPQAPLSRKLCAFLVFVTLRGIDPLQ